jgi:hypothetical protein
MYAFDHYLIRAIQRYNTRQTTMRIYEHDHIGSGTINEQTTNVACKQGNRWIDRCYVARIGND